MDQGILHSGGREKEWADWKVLVALLAFAFLLRLPLPFFPEVIHNDGTEYIRHAQQIMSGNLSEGRSPPLYPLLIGGVQVVTGDYETAGIWVSVIFGTFLVLPIFYLGGAIFNGAVGILSGLFAAVHPFLYMSSGSVLTESTYHFFFTTSALFGWYAFANSGFSRLLLFSLFTTLAYLTRPEAIGLLIVFSACTLLMDPPNGERHFSRRIGMVLMVGITFFIFSFPHLYQIRKDTGTWGISKKAALSVGSLTAEEEAPSFGKPRGKKGLTVSSLLKNPLTVLARMGTGLAGSLYKFHQGLNPLLFILAVLGWILLFRRQNVYPWKGNFFLLSHLIFYFGFVFPFFFITKRHTSQMISISIPWAAFGFLESTQWLHRRWGKGVPLKKFSIYLLILVLAGLFVQGRVIHSREIRIIRKEAGLWMRDHLPRGMKVMSRLPQEAFYAELPWIRIPDESYGKILMDARSHGVKYLVIDDDIDENSPGFWENLKEEDLILLKDLQRKGQRMAVFEVVYPRGSKRENGEK